MRHVPTSGERKVHWGHISTFDIWSRIRTKELVAASTVPMEREGLVEAEWKQWARPVQARQASS
jgi:hypothetical protein